MDRASQFQAHNLSLLLSGQYIKGKEAPVMVSLATVRASNQRLKAAIPGTTALFVGGTTGIGQNTLRQLAMHVESPKVYIIGRSEQKASPFLAELGRLNPRGNFQFIETDVSLIRNVDKACKMIKDKEDRLNMLFMTPGGISLSGRKGMFIYIRHNTPKPPVHPKRRSKY